MRQLTLRMLTSIDGFIADPAGDLKFARWSDEMQQQYLETFVAAGGAGVRPGGLPEVRAVLGGGSRLGKARPWRSRDRR